MIVEKVVLYICIFLDTTVTPPTFTTGLNWAPLEHLRTLASGSELGPLKHALRIVNWESLERSLPVVNGNP